MSNEQPYFIYLDSKILGTAKQIAAFFHDGIFPKEKTTVLIKKYKHKSSSQLARIFAHNGISYRFVSYADLDNLQSGFIFYPFNAQSNCRAVANRKLEHIFITHGESNKAASVKPIIRIYDYVTTAGQAGIDRFLKARIFSQYDVDTGRIIMMGDTFIGRTGLGQDKSGKKCIFYAPTWEGGIEQENYSSLSLWQNIGNYLIQASQLYQVDCIVIKPHPNTGHRKKAYKDYLLQLIALLKENGLAISLFMPNISLSFWQIRKLKRQKVTLIDTLVTFNAEVAFCDISSIETQLLNENIPYYLYEKPKTNYFILNSPPPSLSSPDSCQYRDKSLGIGISDHCKNHVINAKISSYPIETRISLLLERIQQLKRKTI